MKYTSNYNFKKPENADTVNIDDFNSNADAIDTKMKDIETNNENLNTTFKNLIINAGNSNAEIVTSRTSNITGKSYDTMGDRLDDHDEKLQSVSSSLAENVQQTAINTNNISILQSTKVNKNELPSTAFAYKGNCLFAQLPTSNNAIGDQYFVTDKINYYAWNGTIWNNVGYYGLAIRTIEQKHLIDDLLKKISLINHFPIISEIRNLFDKAQVTGTNTYIDSSNYIPVSVGEVYTTMYYNGTSVIKNANQYIDFYNSNKTLLSETSAIDTITIPANCSYLMLRPPLTMVNNYMIAKGKVLLSKYYDYMDGDISYNVEYNTIQNIMNAFMQYTRNLFDKTAIKVGWYVNASNGDLVANSGYVASDYIMINKNTTYSLNYSGLQFAYYDENKVYVSGSTTSNPMTTPSNATYIRLSIAINTVDLFQFEQGLINTDYIEYGLKLEKQYYSSEDIKNIFESLFMAYSKNLYNKNSVIMNSYVSSTDGQIRAYANFTASDYIPVKSSTNYSCNHTGYQYAWYDSNKNFISGAETTTLMASPSNACYIRISVYVDQLDLFQFEEGSQSTSYVTYGLKIKDAYIPDGYINSLINNSLFSAQKYITHWNGAVMDNLGDSITAMGLWQPIIQTMLGLSKVNNHGIGGAVVTNLSSRDSFVNMVLNVDTTSDIITVFGGANDFMSSAPMGSIGNGDNTTFIGALQYVLEYLITHTVKKTIILIAPYQQNYITSGTLNANGYYENSLGLTLEDYVNTIKNVGDFYGIPTLDLYHTSGINRFNIDNYSSDKLHVNGNGGPIIGRQIANFINRY